MLILHRIPKEIFPSVHLLLALVCQWRFLGARLAANILGLSRDEFETICNHASAVVCYGVSGKDLELDPLIDTSRAYTQTGQDALVKISRQLRTDFGGQISFYHKSFKDFLLDPARSGSHYVKASEAVAKHYLKMHLKYDRSYCWEGSCNL